MPRPSVRTPSANNKYLHARYYDPGLGTFLSPDPMHPAEPGVGLHRYGYGFGDPLNGTDRLGHVWADCSDGSGDSCWYEFAQEMVVEVGIGGIPIGVPWDRWVQSQVLAVPWAQTPVLAAPSPADPQDPSDPTLYSCGQ